MQIDFTASEASPPETSVVGLLLFQDEPVAGAVARLDALLGGQISRALCGAFRADAGDTLQLIAPLGVAMDRVLLIGGGSRAAFGEAEAERCAAAAVRATTGISIEVLALHLAECSPEQAAAAAFGARLASYSFRKYKSVATDDRTVQITMTTIVCGDPTTAKTHYGERLAVAAGVELARDLTSEPPNVLHPGEFANRMEALRAVGLEVEALGEAEMASLGMGALLGVGAGSARESRLIVLRWTGADPEAPPLALVGKGVCFDSGGLSLKPADGMKIMKADMAGAAAVAGAMYALALRKARANVVAVLGLVENMPSGSAQRPSDVVRTASGLTVEIVNTDAEGRLVLADALWYAVQLKPCAVVDLATLTNAMITALGDRIAGLLSNDDDLAAELQQSAAATGENVWRLPLVPEYRDRLRSKIADVKQVGGREGGAILAALFLSHFVDVVPWAHLDILGVSWWKRSESNLHPAGATGFGVRLLDRLAQQLFA